MSLGLLLILESGLRDLQTTRYAHISALTTMAYDWGLTLDSEIGFFWRGDWSLVRALFFLNRYFPICAQVINVAGFTGSFVTDKVRESVGPLFQLVGLSSQLVVCNSWLKGLLPSQALIQWCIADVIICHRLWSLYRHNRAVLVITALGYCSAIVSVIIIYALTLPSDPITARPAAPFVNSIHACASLQTKNNLYAIFIGPLVFEALACVLALYKVREQARDMRPRGGATRGPTTRLHYVLARDSLGYFVIILVIYLIDMLIFRFARSTLREVFDGIVFAIGSISCTRLLINLREVGAGAGTDDTTEVFELGVRSKRARSRSAAGGERSIPFVNHSFQISPAERSFQLGGARVAVTDGAADEPFDGVLNSQRMSKSGVRRSESRSLAGVP